MEFIVNAKKYMIVDHELFINYLMVDSYFREFSLYDYDIHFDFLDSILNKEKITFDDILEGTEVLKELIEKEEINFIPAGLSIYENANETFRITYQSLEYDGVNVGEAIPLMIVMTSLLNHNPVISLFQIDEELRCFLVKFRSYSKEVQS